MDTKTFNNFRKIVYEKSGIHLHEGKEALVCARLAKRMRTLGISDYKSYLKTVIEDESGDELICLIDAISTNVTSFFREPDHFEFLGKKVEEWLEEGTSRLRIWSAACSSGEEPYSIAIQLQEILQNKKTDTRILATDISTKVLQKAREGIYKPSKIEPISALLRDKYFDNEIEKGEKIYTVKQRLKNMIVFSRLNLAIPPFPMQGPFDVIFCRNVMIYFDNDVRRKLLDEMYRLLKPGGYLMVGHAESLTGMVSSFRSVKAAIYTK